MELAMIRWSDVESDATENESVVLSDAVFGQVFNEPLVHQVVVSYLAGGRSGTRAQKTRAEVRGGGAKPWKQKGTGRARAGSIRSPLWRGGGRIFAAKPQDFTQKINKKMYRGAMRSILSELCRQERLILVDAVELEQTKTKTLLAHLNRLGLGQVLIVTDREDDHLLLSARNLISVAVRHVGSVDPVSLIKYPKVLMVLGAVRQFEEVLG